MEQQAVNPQQAGIYRRPTRLGSGTIANTSGIARHQVDHELVVAVQQRTSFALKHPMTDGTGE